MSDPYMQGFKPYTRIFAMRNLKVERIAPVKEICTCLCCGRPTDSMQVIGDYHNGVGGSTVVYRCACGKEVIHTI